MNQMALRSGPLGVLVFMSTACLAFSCQGSKTGSPGQDSPHLADGGSAGGNSSSRGAPAGGSDGALECPVRDTMCPMIFQPVHCKLSLGERLLKELDAENSCVGTLKLREAWCEAVAADPDLLSNMSGNKGSPVAPILKCERRQGGESDL